MANYSFVLKDDNILGFYPVRNTGVLKTDEDVENLFNKTMQTSNMYKDREIWDRPELIGIVKGVVNWHDVKVGHDMEYTREKYAK